MKYRRSLISLSAVMLTAGCTASPVRQTESAERLYEYSDEEAVSITLKQDTAETTDESVLISEQNITIAQPGTYVVTGELENGRITIDCEQKGTVQIVFMNVRMTSQAGPVLFVENAEEVILSSEAGTNAVFDVSGEDENGKKAAVHAKDDLVLGGTGTFTITSADGDGIHAGDSLTVTDAKLVITSASDGIDVNETFAAADASFEIHAGKDGIHAGDEEAENPGGDIVITSCEMDITAEDDAVQSEGKIDFTEGTYTFTAGGGSANAAARNDPFSWGGSFDFSSRPGNSQGREEQPSQRPKNGQNGSGQFQMPGNEENKDNSQNGFEGFGDPEETEGFEDFFDDLEGMEGFEDFFGSLEGIDGFEDIFGDLEGLEDFGQYLMPDGEEGTWNLPDSFDFDYDAEDFTEETSETAKGISAEGTVTFTGGTYTFDTADDAVHSSSDIVVNDGTFAIRAGDDAFHADNDLTFENGTVTIESSYEGLEGKNITVKGGEVSITASDDGINSVDKENLAAGMFSSDGSTVTFSGGTVIVDAAGDGIDSNGSVLINGGTLIVYGPVNSANGALDYAGTFTVESGKLMAGGASGMAMTPSSSKINVLVVGTSGSGTVTVKDDSGNTVAEYTSEKSYQHLVIADEAIKTGETYTVYKDGRELGTVTVKDTVTKLNVSGNGSFNPGGMSPGQGSGRPGSRPENGNGTENKRSDSFPGGSNGFPGNGSGESEQPDFLPDEDNQENETPGFFPWGEPDEEEKKPL